LREEKEIIEFSLGELFCGPGGLALGAVRSIVNTEKNIFRIKHSWANDYDKDTCETYKKNICPNNSDFVICSDVKNLNLSQLPKINCFAYGFPCNDFSNVGERKGFNGEYGPLYTYGIKVINYFNPEFFVAENVGGIRSANEGKAFEKIINDLTHAGYGYNLSINLYKSEEYGIPQTRHRIVIVGIRKDLKKYFKIPEPITKNEYVNVKYALENPPIDSNAFNNELTKQSKIVIERLKYIKPGENAWTAKLPEHLKLNVKNTKISQIYKRLSPNKPSYTITGSGGGGTHGYHWSENRALTNRERARIQTFPDNFIFCGSKESVRKQIGMAVPPKLSEIIFTAILKTFANVQYNYINSEFIQSELKLFKNE